MIVVHGFAPMPPLPSPSPFCVKLETWLRMAQFAYEARWDYNPLRAPKGKAPYVTLDDGTVLADTHHIIRKLSERPGVTLDAWLGPKERATTTLVQRTIENHLYFAVLRERWIEPDGWKILPGAYFGHMKPPARWVVPVLARRSARKITWFEGTGRHTRAEVIAAAEEDLDALVSVLGDRPYICGDRPSTADAIAYGTLASLLWSPFPGPLTDATRARPTLVRYAERIRERYWP
ncbi:MAG: glutathione S-transferase family protein [Myxococcota bacterium]